MTSFITEQCSQQVGDTTSKSDLDNLHNPPESITPIDDKLVGARLQGDKCDLRLRCEQADRLLEIQVTQAPVSDEVSWDSRTSGMMWIL